FEPHSRLLEGAAPRNQLADCLLRAIDLALRRPDRVLRLAPCLALRPIRLPRSFEHCSQRIDRGFLVGSFTPFCGDFGIEFGEPVATGKPLGGDARRVGSSDETIPAPKRAIPRDQKLAGLERLRETRAVRGVDEAGLVEPAP